MSGGLIRRVVQGVAVLGLAYALFYTFVQSAAEQKSATKIAKRRRALRQQTTQSGTHLRPLDPSIAKRPLPHEYKRWVLGLYNSLDGGDEGVTPAEYNHVHLKAELILNHLGLLVELHDVNKPLPDDAHMKRFRGVIAWYDKNEVRHPVVYLRWLRHQAAAGRKIVLITGLKASKDTKGSITPYTEILSTFNALGLDYRGNFTDDPHRIAIMSKDPAVVEFERKLPKRLEYYEQVKPLLPEKSFSFLKVKRTDLADGESDMVVVTPQGGYVAPDYVINEQQFGNHYAMQWRLNPFVFFAKALGLPPDAPSPDFTTLNGSRIYYSHIDGDGLPSITEVNRKSMCADFARTQILEPYDLPATVSFVIAGIDLKARGDRFRLKVAQKIAALPNVEIAVHGFAHPMDWRARGKAMVSYEVKGYHMKAEKEIHYAANFTNRRIAPPGKSARVMLWTGWCNPAEDQIAIAYKFGLYNLNGGDPIMDAQYPSYLHLAPPMHKVGKYTQFFTSGPNDYILTEEWQPPYHRYANLIQTFQNTGVPRRVYPLNVYYHFYVVEKPAALRAIKDVLQWVERQHPAPLWVSHYVDVVRDFASVRIERIASSLAQEKPPTGTAAASPHQSKTSSPTKVTSQRQASPQATPKFSTWRVHNSAYLRTIRFDLEHTYVNLNASKGVLGYRFIPEVKALYVHLDASHDHTIVLTPHRAQKPFLLRASAYLEDFKISKTRTTFTMSGIGQKYLSLSRLTPRANYHITAHNKHGKKIDAKIFTDAAGTLNWNGKINGDKIPVTIERLSK